MNWVSHDLWLWLKGTRGTQLEELARTTELGPAVNTMSTDRQLHCLAQTSYLLYKWLRTMWAYPTTSEIVATVGIRAWLEALTDYSQLVPGLARLKGATWGPGR